MTRDEAINAMIEAAVEIVKETPRKPRQRTTLVDRRLVVVLQNALRALGRDVPMRELRKLA
jgi:hypothetical protein